MNISLGGNPIESRGVQIISEALKTHILIQELHFGNEQSIFYIEQFIYFHTYIKHLFM